MQNTRGIIEWLERLGVKPLSNMRNVTPPWEVDVWIPDKKIAIEYHGLYWHREAIVGQKRHQQKAIAAKEAGVSLIQVFSDEWEYKQEICKSLIKAKLGMSTRLFARKCKIVPVTGKEGREFFKENHLQGADSASVYLGLMHDSKLMCVMSFSKVSDGVWKISRFASTLGHNVIGGLSRLLSKFIKDYSPKTIETYANGRYSTGAAYAACGFEPSGLTPPGYFYTSSSGHFKKREPRQKYQVWKMKALGYTGTERNNGSAGAAQGVRCRSLEIHAFSLIK